MGYTEPSIFMPLQQPKKTVTGTFTTICREDAKKEYEKEIVYWAMKLSSRKWWQNNRNIKRKIKRWCDELKNLTKK